MIRAVAEIFSESSVIQSLLRVEAALAQAQAQVGVIPAEAARTIAAHARIDELDVPKLREQTRRTGYPVAPLVRQLTAACGEHGRYVHWGATTQDILNTALALQVNESLARLHAELRAAMKALAGLVRTHRDTLMVGRTFGGHALPITFGFKAAVWLSGLLRHAQRLRNLRDRPLEGEFAGVGGTLASLGGRGLDVRAAFMQVLGLPEPLVTWASQRDRVVEITGFLAGLCGSAGKIAFDVSELSGTDIGELAEPVSGGKDASSTLPFKANPIYCGHVMTAATLVGQHAGAVLAAIRQREERSSEGMLEYESVPQAFVQAERCLANLRTIVDGLQVFPERMRSNLALTRGVILAERYMMALAPHLGRLAAHDLVHDACKAAVEQGVEVGAVLARTPEVMRHLDAAALAELGNPAGYLGEAQRMIDAVLAELGKRS
ncbi:MAG: adenylosuccinate lyase family protein [Burkholderiales bacterium]